MGKASTQNSGAPERGVPLQRAAVGGDGVVGGHGEVEREGVGREPADVVSFVGLAVAGFSSEHAGEIGGGDPVLGFVGKKVVGDAEEAVDGDFDADLLEGLADGAMLEGFEEVELAADDAPAPGFGRAFAEGEEDATVGVDEENANADFRGAEGVPRC